MLAPAHRLAILDAVDAAFDEQTAFTSKVVEASSLRGAEGAAQDLLEHAYRGLGLEIDRWTLDPAELAQHPAAGAVVVDYAGSEVLVGTYIPPNETGPSLILNGHIDVVPTGAAEFWSRSPFESPVRDGWLYGRGAADMKAGLVANHFAFRAIAASGLRPTGRIHLQSVPEEESTGNGTVSALQHGYRADAVLITEPTQGRLVRAHVGVIWFRVRVSGQAAHAAMMEDGSNAVDAAYALITDLRGLEAAWNDAGSEHFPGQQHPFNFNVGKINGGDWPSSVPDWCEFEMRIGFPPGLAVEDAWAQVRAAVARSAEQNRALQGMTPTVSKTGFFSDGYALPDGTVAEAALSSSFTAATGRELESRSMTGYIDSRVYGLFDDTPSMVFGPVGERIHGADERVNLDSLREVTRTAALFIAEWCGVEDARPDHRDGRRESLTEGARKMEKK